MTAARSSMREHSGQALPGTPNGPADLEAAGGPVASQGLAPHSAAPLPCGPTVPVSGPGRIGSSLHQPSGDQPEGRFDPLVGCSHTPTAHHRTYVLLPCDPSRAQVQPQRRAVSNPFRFCSSGCHSRLGLLVYGTYKEAATEPTGRVGTGRRVPDLS